VCVCRLLSRVHVDCLEIRRMGSFDDGGYDLCTSLPYHFTSQSDCLVYSFGSVHFSLTLLSLCLSVSVVCIMQVMFMSLTLSHNMSMFVSFLFQQTVSAKRESAGRQVMFVLLEGSVFFDLRCTLDVDTNYVNVYE